MTMIILHFDHQELDWASFFLTQFKAHHGERKHRILLSTLGLTAYELATLYSLYQNLSIENIDYLDNPYELPIEHYSTTELSPYRRCFILADIMSRYQDELYLLMDCKLSIKGSLDPLFTDLVKADYLLLMNDVKQEIQFFPQVIAISPSGKSFIDHCCQSISEKLLEGALRSHSTDRGEIAVIKEAYFSQLTTLSCATIPIDNYLSTAFSKEALIWYSDIPLDHSAALDLFKRVHYHDIDFDKALLNHYIDKEALSIVAKIAQRIRQDGPSHPDYEYALSCLKLMGPRLQFSGTKSSA